MKHHQLDGVTNVSCWIGSTKLTQATQFTGGHLFGNGALRDILEFAKKKIEVREANLTDLGRDEFRVRAAVPFELNGEQNVWKSCGLLPIHKHSISSPIKVFCASPFVKSK